MSVNHNHCYNHAVRNWLFKVFDKASHFSPSQLTLRACPICGGSEFKPFVNNGSLDYVQCAYCELVFQNPALCSIGTNNGFEGDDPLLREYFEIAARYKTGVPPRPDPETHGKLKDIYALRPTGRLLDVGCSVGDFLHLARHFYEVEGVEINPFTAAIAKQHFTIYTDYLSALKLPAVYDIVTLHQILYGVSDPLGLLRDIRSVLRPDGLLYVNSPNADSYATRVFGGKCCHFYGYTSLNVFNPKSLARLAELSGFRIVTLRTEWFDVYSADVQEFFDHPELFIHKRNSHLPDYEKSLSVEDNMHHQLANDLGGRGNYVVAILAKL